ncbi:MAG: alpha/beta hydrolase, partial [Tenericutes bacterium]|nr:alpha/beta hydrolase [Mycoplasmatota bacterium]
KYRTYNNYNLVGILNKKNDNDEIVIICHARSSNKDSRVNTKLSNELNKNNINNFRFDFISCGESKADYKEYSITNMIKNLEDTINMLKNKYNYTKIILFGSSIGGKIVSLIEIEKYNVIKIILWYPSLDYNRTWMNLAGKKEKYAKKIGYYQFKNGTKLSYEYFKDERSYYTFKELRKQNLPVLFVHGTNDHYVEVKSSIKVSKKCKNAKLFLIEGGDHGFHKDDDMIKALNITVEFLLNQ